MVDFLNDKTKNKNLNLTKNEKLLYPSKYLVTSGCQWKILKNLEKIT